MAERLKRNNGFIPGINWLKTLPIISELSWIELPYLVLFFLALIGIMPGVAGQLKITQGFASFYGGTSMLIMVGVVLDTLQQIESQLLMRHYDGSMKTGRITGRQAVFA